MYLKLHEKTTDSFGKKSFIFLQMCTIGRKRRGVTVFTGRCLRKMGGLSRVQFSGTVQRYDLDSCDTAVLESTRYGWG